MWLPVFLVSTRSALAAGRFDMVFKITLAVVVGELFPLANAAPCINKNTLPVYFRIAIWLARMVEVTGKVFSRCAVDY